MKSILGDQADAHFSQPPAMMYKEEAVPIPPKSHSFHTLDGAHMDELPAPEELEQSVSRLHLRPVPTLSVDDATNTEDETRNLEADGHPSASTSETSADTDDMLTKVPSLEDVESLEPQKLPPFRSLKLHANTTDEIGHRGHAHDPLEDHLYLRIGPSTFSGVSPHVDNDGGFIPDDDDDDAYIVSESPGAADVDIYETAYRDEIERIMAKAKEQNKEPNVYLTRRVDEKLMAISGLAGKWAAMGEEAKKQINAYTQFSTRKARVTEVSRALRQAARQEYERRKQERREQIAAEKTQRSKDKAEGHEAFKPPVPDAAAPTGGEVEERMTGSPQAAGRQPSLWRGKAVDKGRQARTSVLGLMDMVKNKSRTRGKEDER